MKATWAPGAVGKRSTGRYGKNMGMRTYWAGVQGRTGGSYVSGGTSSFPVTGFPATAYLGNNRRYMAGGPQSQPSPMAGGLGQIAQYDPRHSLIVIVVLIGAGVLLWHLDNR